MVVKNSIIFSFSCLLLIQILQGGMKKLNRLKPRVKLLTDFFVFDVETGVDAQHTDLVPVKSKWHNFDIHQQHTGIQWILKGRPETFKFGVIYGYNFTKVIYSLEEFIQEFKDPRYKKKKIFAHNATYDLTTLFGNIFTVDPTAIFNGSRFITCTNGNCTFADSMNIFVGQSVKKIGEQLGIEKQKLGETENLWSPEGITSTEINYCIRDCEIVWDALIKSFEFAGDIKITQASLSMTYFRRHHQAYNIEHNENTAYFWDSYYGGRTEAFKLGKTNSVVYDVKSMYPEQMRNLEFPNPKHLKIETNVDLKFFTCRILPNYEGCVYADVIHDYLWCGLLPVRREGKLCFPIGNLSGCWNFNEFRFALSTGKIKIQQIKKIVYSEKMSSPFAGYVDQLFILKNKAESEGNDFWRDLYKRYQNSLYGKFAQRIDEESIYIENIEKQFDIILEYQKKGLFKKLMLFNAERLDAFLIVGTTKNISISYSIPSFASYITSGARVKILKKLLECEKNKVVYCDTDSIFIENDFGIESENFLGGWCKEEKIVTEIRGLKNYKFLSKGKEYHRLKGVPSKAKKTGENSYQYFNLVKTKESLRRNLEAGVLIERTKKITGKYTKRTILYNGETEPIIL